jgi:serine/threonine-protein kinase
MAERWRPGSFESFLDDKVESYISPIANDIALRSEAARSQTPRELAAALGERYSVGSVIGVGGMATVYLAHDQAFGRAVAVKVLHSALADSLGVGRFMQEIEVTARLEHSRIVPVHERGEAAGLLYFVMRYFEAGSLRQHIEREGKLTIPNAISIARDVAQALDYAHARGVIHRDVKPANILLEGLNAFVADFGISKLVDVAGSGRLTSRGVVVGTPEYMSPEQAEPGGRLDGRSDVYSLGCVVYEMLAGEPPYAATSRRDVLAKHAAAAIPDLSILRPIVTLAMRQSVEKALQKSPADRYRTCGEFVAALESAAREAPPPAPHFKRA